MSFSEHIWSVCAVLFLAVGLFASGFGFGYNYADSYHEELEKTAQIEAAQKQKEISDEYAKVLDEANRRQVALFSDFTRLHDAHSGLRESLQNNLPAVASDAEIDAILARGELLTACSDRYADLAEKADRHVHDLRTIRAAWEKVNETQKP